MLLIFLILIPLAGVGEFKHEQSQAITHSYYFSSAGTTNVATRAAPS
jgi:hypothetical protein